MTKLAVSLALALGLFVYSEGVSVAAPYSKVGGACVPVDSSIQNGTYATGSFGVKGVYNSSATFICGIEDATEISGWFYIYYGYTHTTYAPITVKLRSAAFGSNVSTTHVTCQADTSTTGFDSKPCNYSGTYDSGRHYWFEVTISRNSGTVLVNEFLGVRFN